MREGKKECGYDLWEGSGGKGAKIKIYYMKKIFFNIEIKKNNNKKYLEQVATEVEIKQVTSHVPVRWAEGMGHTA